MNVLHFAFIYTLNMLSKTGCNDFCRNAVRGRSKKTEK